MIRLLRACLALCLLSTLIALSRPASAQTSYPMITHATPVAVQRGKETEVAVDGRMDFVGAYQVIVEGKGVSAEIVPPAKKPAAGKPVTRLQLKFKVAADAPLGVREFRIATSKGLSSLGQLLIVDAPVILEKEKNNTRDQANSLPVPGVAAGTIDLEDVDVFRFEAQAGKTYTFDVRCARIQDKIHDLQKHADPLLALIDSTGRELAVSDDFYFADPLLSYTIKKTGAYFIQIRDSKYDGDRRWVYALSATDRPYVSHVYPMAAQPGATIEVEPVGSARLAKPKVKLKAPDQVGAHLVTLDIDGVATNPTLFLVSPLPQVLEVEPNDTMEKAQQVSLPAGLNGRIGTPRDLDYFAFTGKKGQPLRFEVKARRFGTELFSSLDAMLEVMNAKGKVLAGNDDSNGKDAQLVFTPPADGSYLLRLRDLNSKGGDTFVYHIVAEVARPDFALRCDPDKAMIGPGSSAAWYVHVQRDNGFAGPVQVQVKNLPRGVKASPLTIAPTMTQGVIVLTAAEDAPRGVGVVEVIGTAKLKQVDGKEQQVTRTAQPNQEIYQPGGGRALFDVNHQAVAVTEPSDILKIETTPQEIVLKPGQEVKIDVTLQRRADYQKPVTIDVKLSHLNRLFATPLPPGVTVVAGKSKTAVGTGTKGHIVLKAAANAAPIERVPISVLAHVSINFVVKVSYSSAPIWITIKK